ncbi:hypothetical protein [Dapis sp. BLCC M172]|uniref:hypothetical protein n=1 Tax=Dapis sp. BLCC M172 TaxID=2975281 RepID=UPI003CFA1EE0
MQRLFIHKCNITHIEIPGVIFGNKSSDRTLTIRKSCYILRLDWYCGKIVALFLESE